MVRKTTRKASTTKRSNAARMSAAMSKGRAGMRTTKRSAKSAVRSARNYIRKNPKKVAAVAAGLIAAGGYTLRRRAMKAKAR